MQRSLLDTISGIPSLEMNFMLDPQSGNCYEVSSAKCDLKSINLCRMSSNRSIMNTIMKERRSPLPRLTKRPHITLETASEVQRTFCKWSNPTFEIQQEVSVIRQYI